MRKSKQRVIFSFFILSLCYGITIAADSPCGDWEPYKDEKCFKIIDETLRIYDDAVKTCGQQENSATLVIIRSNNEQDFLSNLLFKTHKTVENIWIGIKYTSNKFKWVDDSELGFTNWAAGSPRNITDNGCVQMQSDVSSIGKWIDEPCSKKNLVVCQKMQNWSISRLQKTLLNTRKEFEDITKQLKDSHDDSKKEINNLKQNPVPIGFIYVQLPSQPEPKTLWSTVEWKDVTSDYAGLFFRAEGGGSAVFEQTQQENSPRLTAVGCHIGDFDYHSNDKIKLVAGETSKYFYTGSFTMYPLINQSLSFEISGGEVRPRNKAIRIWKRAN